MLNLSMMVLYNLRLYIRTPHAASYLYPGVINEIYTINTPPRSLLMIIKYNLIAVVLNFIE